MPIIPDISASYIRIRSQKRDRIRASFSSFRPSKWDRIPGFPREKSHFGGLIPEISGVRSPKWDRIIVRRQEPVRFIEGCGLLTRRCQRVAHRAFHRWRRSAARPEAVQGKGAPRNVKEARIQQMRLQRFQAPRAYAACDRPASQGADGQLGEWTLSTEGGSWEPEDGGLRTRKPVCWEGEERWRRVCLGQRLRHRGTWCRWNAGWPSNHALARDFGDARQFQPCCPLPMFLAKSGFVLPVTGVPEAPEARR